MNSAIRWSICRHQRLGEGLELRPDPLRPRWFGPAAHLADPLPSGGIAQGETVLTLAIASADHARIQVFVNGDRKPVAEVAPAVQGGNALVREGIHAKYCVQYVTIPAGRLKAGENTIALAPLASVCPGPRDVRLLSLELP